MNVRNCRKCGKIFNYVVGLPICPACKDEMEATFQKVKKYVQDHRGCTIAEVAEECEVEAQQIRQWVREERLEFADGAGIGIECEMCGAAISSGRFCEKCKAEMTNNLKSAFGSKPAPQKPAPDTKQSPKMRFLQ